MIAKHVPMRSAGKSDFAGLARYITDKQSKEHRLGNVYITNCDAETVRDAITEILATQQINTRAKGDKTYHRLSAFALVSSRAMQSSRRLKSGLVLGLAMANISASWPYITILTTCICTLPLTKFTRARIRSMSPITLTEHCRISVLRWSRSLVWSGIIICLASVLPLRGRTTRNVTPE